MLKRNDDYTLITQNNDRRPGGGFMWMNHLHSVTAGVMVSTHRTDRVIQAYFPNGSPVSMPFDFTVVIDGKDFDPSQQEGALRRASVCEQAFAVLRAVQRYLKKEDNDATASFNEHTQLSCGV